MFPNLKRKWQVEGCSYVPANIEEIDAFERKYSVRLPDDFRTYFLELNGTKFDGDSQLFEFAPIDKLQTWRESNWKIPSCPLDDFDADHLFIFCDYMISCWAYAIFLDPFESKRGKVMSCGWITEKIIADSFTDFIDLYLADDPGIYPPSTTPVISRPFLSESSAALTSVKPKRHCS